VIFKLMAYYLVQQLKIELSYRFNLLIGLIGQLLFTLLSVVFVGTFLKYGQTINGWGFYDILGIPYLVFHPGSHGGAGVETGLANVTKNLDLVMEQADQATHAVTILLETTAGQGTGLGYRFEELAWILDHANSPDRLGVCVDTCHIFAAGYDIRTPETYAATFAEFDRLIGVEQIRFFHLNDSRKELGSRVDRHEHIGRGCIGLEGFRQLLHDSRFRDHPMTLETPKGKDLAEDKENLAVLRSL